MLASPALDSVGAIVAWGVIATLVAVVFLAIAIERASNAAATAGGGEDRGGMVIAEVQGRYLLGIHDLLRRFGTAATQGQIADGVRELEAGSFGQRLRAAALTGVLVGPEAGIEATDRAAEFLAASTEPDETPAPEQIERLEALREVLRADGGETAASPQARAIVIDGLGWFGELVVAEGHDPALRGSMGAASMRVAVAMFALLAGALLLGLAGVVGIALAVGLALAGKFRLRFSVGAPRGGVYVETFAAWLLLLFCGSIAAELLLPRASLAGGGAAMLASLLALAWLPIRGVPWDRARAEIGLHRGRGILAETAAGVAAYAMALPLVGVGLAIMFGLMALGAGSGGEGTDTADLPTHPLAGFVADGGVLAKVAAFVVAAMIAPLVEEIVFRGVLYRHLREATRRLRVVASALLSMTIMSFVFAAIHPQGALGIPVLMALAFGFAFAREWRDSLVGPMVAHALNNGAITLLLLVVFA